MAEQNQTIETEKTEDTAEDTENTEEIVEDNDTVNPDVQALIDIQDNKQTGNGRTMVPLYKTRQFVDDVLRMHDKENISFQMICEMLRDKYQVPTISKIRIEDIYNQNSAKRLLMNKDADKVFDKYYEGMGQRYERACTMVDWLTDSIEEMKRQIDETDGPDKKLLFIKLSPTILATAREIISQLRFLREEQEKIKVQQKNLIYSPMQINLYMTRNLKEWQKKGYIRVLKQIPEMESEDETENGNDN